MLHDCVILPGMGGFVANYKPAEFDPARNTANPPSKHILFNRNLLHNDGLLYAHVSKVSGFGYKDVQEKAEAFVAGIQKDTARGIKYEIDGLGYFFLDKEGQIQFTEESGNNFLLESYGLPYLQYKEIGKPKIETYRSASPVTDPLARQRKIRRWTYGTAAACLLAAMIIVPIKTGYFNQAGLDIPVAESIRKDSPSPTERLIHPEAHESYDKSQSKSTPSTGETMQFITPLPTPEYNIVVGSFKDFSNARTLRNQLVEKGYESRILGTQKGMFRVTAGTYSLKDEASVELAFVMADFENAWVLSN